MTKKSTLYYKTLPLIFLFFVLNTQAAIQNIACTGYNADVVANGSGTTQSSTTSDIDGANFVFVKNDFNPGTSCGTFSSLTWGATQTVTGGSALTYNLQAATANNSLRVSGGNSGTLNVSTPIAATTLYILATGGNGACTVDITVTFTDNSKLIFLGQTVKDWCTGSSPATGTFYRSLRNGSTTCSLNPNPKMFELSLNLTAANSYRTISSIKFTNSPGTAVLNVFAIGGNINSSTPPACSTPTSQASALSLNSVTSYSVSGSFTAGTGADSYLIIRSTSSSLSQTPTNGTSYPAGSSFGGGTVVNYQSNTSFTDYGPLNEGTIYYYFVFAANSNCTGGPLYVSGAPLSNSSTVTASGLVTFVNSGTWTCPTGVTSIQVECRGAGGGGGYGNPTAAGGGGGGGGGGYTYNSTVAVSAGTTYTVTVGAPGTPGLAGSINGGNGGNSIFGPSLVIANGGGGGMGFNTGTGIGTAGAGGAVTTGSPIKYGGNGSAGSAARAGSGGGGAGSSGNGGNGGSSSGGSAGSGGGGAGAAGESADYKGGANGTSYGGGGAGGTRSANGGTGGNGLVTITCPCTSFYPTFNTSPVDSACAGTSITYTTQIGQSAYVWTVKLANGTTATLGTDYTIAGSGYSVTITFITSGNRTVTANYTASGCPGASPASATTYIRAKPTVTITPTTANACKGMGLAITASPTGGTGIYNTHAWTGAAASSLSATNITNPTFTNNIVNTYALTYTVTDNKGCVGTASKTVTVNNLPTPTFTATPPPSGCAGVNCSYTTQASKSNYSWTIPGTEGTDYTLTGGNSTSNTATITWITAGSKTVAVNYTDGNGCIGTSAASFPSTVNALPTIALSSASGTDAQTVCEGVPITNITYAVGGGATGAYCSAGMPAGLNGSYSAGVFTISGTPTSAGTYNYTLIANASGGCSNATTAGTMVVKAKPNVTFDSNPPSSVCTSSSCTYTTQASQSNYIWTFTGTAGSAYAISSGGTNTSNTVTLNWLTTGSKTVTVNYTNSNGCTGTSVASFPTTVSGPTITLTNVASTASQTVCMSSAISSISYSIAGGATSASATGLPTGVSGSYAGGVFTISGSPSIAGTFTYTVTSNTSGGCSAVSSTGTITVNEPTITLSSVAGTPTQTVCKDESIANISYTIDGGATGASVTGLPSGISGSLTGSVFTISGAATVSGVYPFTVSTTGTCTNASLTGSVIVNALPVVNVSNDTICRGIGKLTANSDISGTTFNWYDSSSAGNLLSSGTGNEYNTSYLSTTTNFYVQGTYNGCTTPSRSMGTVLISADTTNWIGNSDSDWNNASNWTNGIPATCSNIIIKKSSTHFPNIKSLASNVACNKITFEAETSIYGLEKLTYDSANVIVDLARNKWYMLTAPLKEMYSGDYYHEGAPVSSIKLFGANTSASVGTNIVSTTGSWSNSFASLAEKLSPGEGFAYKVETKVWNYPYGAISVTGDVSDTLPRTNSDGSLKEIAYPISGVTGKIYTSMAQAMPKTNNIAYRFAMEDASNKLNSISIPLKQGLNLIGNPLMSHLSFNSLHSHNSTLIEDYVQFWNGTSFGSITTAGISTGATVDGISTTIPPMKSFVVYAKTDGNLIISLSDFTPVKTVNLKSANSNSGLILMETNNGIAKNSSAIYVNTENGITDENDVPKLFTETKEASEIYSVGNGSALDINEIQKVPCLIPIGIKAKSNGLINLNFKGIENLENLDITLINSDNFETQNLKESSSYQFQYNGNNGEGSLYLELRSASTTTDLNKSNSLETGISIVSIGNQIKISTDELGLIQSISIIDESGKTLVQKDSINKDFESITLDANKAVVLVKVKSLKTTTSRKVLLK